jgi:serralysin
MLYLKADGSAVATTANATANLYGSNGAETLTGGLGADGLWGTSGDLLVGGTGDDTYYLQGADIRVDEGVAGGTDRIVAWSNVNLANYGNVENLEVGGDKTYAAGNGRDNLIVATGTNQELYGGAGRDVLVGATSGRNAFIVIKGEGDDALYNFKTGQDVIRLTSDYGSFDQVRSHLSQVGADVSLDLGGGSAVVIRNVSVSQLTAANFQLKLDPAKLGALTFHDEFSGALSLFDAARSPGGTWRPDYDLGGAQSVESYTLTSNGEQQVYTSPYFRGHAGDFAESPFVSNADGTLSILARPSASSEIFGYHYTSGMISSKESFAQTYGYFEMRADIPANAGGWPAFWLLPADRSWPPELDVMEVLTKDANAAWTTVHSATGGHTMDQGVEFIPETTDGMHSYGVLWTRTDLTWYVDGVEVFHAATPADMNKPMYMIANLALGGWGGGVAPGQLPAEMKIDYVRAYALADGSSTVALDTAHTGGGSATPGASSSSGGAASGAAAAASAGASASTGSAAAAGDPASSAPQDLTALATGSRLTGGAGADTLHASQALDTLTGGAGADRFVFAQEPWAPVHITDFQLGADVLDLSPLFSQYGYHGSDPVRDGWVSIESDGADGARIGFDHDGPTGSSPAWPNRIVVLDHVAPGDVTWAKLQGAASAPASSGTGSAPVASAPAPAPVPSTPAPIPVFGRYLQAPALGGPLDGGDGGDTIYGSDTAANVIRGLGGDDRIIGGALHNDINGNLGADTITGHASEGDSLFGGQGNDLISAIESTGRNYLNGNRGDDTLIGGNAGDTLRGGQGDDLITGGSGDDWICGDRGADTVTGGGGADVFHHFAGGGITTVTDFHAWEGDRVHLDAGTAYSVSQVGANVVIDLADGAELILKGVRADMFPQGWLFES